MKIKNSMQRIKLIRKLFVTYCLCQVAFWINITNVIGQFHNSYNLKNIAEGKEVQQTNDGGYVFTGTEYGFGQQPAGVLIRTKPDGVLIWKAQLGPERGEKYNTVVQFSNDAHYDEEFVIGGYSYDNPDHEQQLSLIKIGVVGGNPVIVWKMNYGYKDLEDEVFQIIKNSAGNIIALGRTAINQKTILTVLEVDPLNGNLINQSDNSFDFPLNGNKIIEKSDRGGYMIVGTIPIDIRREIFIVELNNALQVINSYRYYNQINEINLEGVAIRENTNPDIDPGNFVILGRKNDLSINDSEILLFNLNISSIPWVVTWSVESSNIITRVTLFPKDLLLDKDYNAVITGKYLNPNSSPPERKAFLLNIMANQVTSNLQWAWSYLNESETESEKNTADGGYILLGKHDKVSSESFYMVKTDGAGVTDPDCDKNFEFEILRIDHPLEDIRLNREPEVEQVQNLVNLIRPDIMELLLCGRIPCDIEVSVFAVPDTICLGDSVIMTASGASTYSWTPPVTFLSSDGSVVMDFPTTTTTYTVIGTDANGCTGSATVTVTVNQPMYTANAGSDITIILFQGSCVQIGGPPIIPPDGAPDPIYSWTPPSNLNDPTVPNPIACPTANTTYTLTVTDTNGCSTSDQVVISVIAPPPVYRALKKKLDGGFYQPINNKLYFKLEGEYKNGILDYKIFNADRQLVSCNVTSNLLNYGDNRYELNVSACGLITGKYYTLEVTNEKKELFQLRFVK